VVNESRQNRQILSSSKSSISHTPHRLYEGGGCPVYRANGNLYMIFQAKSSNWELVNVLSQPVTVPLRFLIEHPLRNVKLHN